MTLPSRAVATVFARAPLRVSFGGGGTDLPSYYRDHGGFVVSAGIDRYVYMLVTNGFQSRFRLKHLEWEEADHPDEVTHPILREALARHWDGSPLEIASVADALPGTGLGSSGSYTVCVLSALQKIRGEQSTPGELAELASELEIDVLERRVGKQDQYVSAHGGLCAMTFNPDDTVEVRELELDEGAAARGPRQLHALLLGRGAIGLRDVRPPGQPHARGRLGDDREPRPDEGDRARRCAPRSRRATWAAAAS